MKMFYIFAKIYITREIIESRKSFNGFIPNKKPLDISLFGQGVFFIPLIVSYGAGVKTS